MGENAYSSTLFHTAIIGGGAGGLFCAGSFDTPKIVLEARPRPAGKVMISGGGKCNFSNRFVTPADYLSRQEHFCKSALSAFTPRHFTDLLDQAGIPWEERTEGRLFALHQGDIARWLVQRAQQHHTTLACNVRVLDITWQKDIFLLTTSLGPIRAQHVVLATGGISFPQAGGNRFGFTIARHLNLPVVEPRPALCGLLLPKDQRSRFALLAGNSLPVRVRCKKHTFEDALLFTHEGFSGPAMLQISLFWQEGDVIEIDFLPHQDAFSLFRQHKNSRTTLAGALAPYLPSKIAHTLLATLQRDLANASKQQLQEAAEAIHHFRFLPQGTSGYTKAEVTAGGIDTRSLHPSTCEVRTQPGLFIIGELLDVTGRLGGFNLHWAWCSGAVAAAALKKRF